MYEEKYKILVNEPLIDAESIIQFGPLFGQLHKHTCTWQHCCVIISCQFYSSVPDVTFGDPVTKSPGAPKACSGLYSDSFALYNCTTTNSLFWTVRR
jgi:hypothetical protein